MTLASEFQRGINSLYSAAGQPAQYTDRDATVTAVTVLLDFDLSRYGDAVEVAQSEVSISVRASEVPQSPRRGDTFTVDGTTYVVGPALSSDELEHTVLCA